MPRQILFEDMSGIIPADKLGEYQVTMEDYKRLQPYLAWLPPSLADCFVMSKFGGMTSIAIARALGITQPNVLSKTKRAAVYLERIVRRQKKLPLLIRFLREHSKRYCPTHIRLLISAYFSGTIHCGGRISGITCPGTRIDDFERRLTKDGNKDGLALIQMLRTEPFKRLEQRDKRNGNE